MKNTHYQSVMTGEALSRWRKSRRLTRTQLAELLPVALITLQNWERGRTKIPLHLSRALKDVDRSSRFLKRDETVDLTTEESDHTIGQVITGYSSRAQDYDRLHLTNGWAIVLPSASTGRHWFVENYQALVDESKHEYHVFRCGWGSAKPRVLIGAARVSAQFKVQGNLHPTEEEVQQACLAIKGVTTEETLAIQEEVLQQLRRRQQELEDNDTDEDAVNDGAILEVSTWDRTEHGEPRP